MTSIVANYACASHVLEVNCLRPLDFEQSLIGT